MVFIQRCTCWTEHWASFFLACDINWFFVLFFFSGQHSNGSSDVTIPHKPRNFQMMPSSKFPWQEAALSFGWKLKQQGHYHYGLNLFRHTHTHTRTTITVKPMQILFSFQLSPTPQKNPETLKNPECKELNERRRSSSRTGWESKRLASNGAELLVADVHSQPR